jgi:anthranilate synthase/aminodeoxychorismate synthase-like glutamine amidotransferase
MLLMIDNYDSFTYNLVQYLGELGEEVKVIRNDEMTVDAIAELAPARIVLSPGPCTPNEAGVSLEVVRRFAGRVPILGVCLGHQAIGQAFGGRVVHARTLMHGKVSAVHHSGAGVFAGFPHPTTRRATIRSPSSGRAVRPSSRSPRGRRTERSWECATASLPSRASSSTPSRSSPSTATRCSPIS